MSKMSTPRHARANRVRGVYRLDLKLAGFLALLLLLGAAAGYLLFQPPKAVVPEAVGDIPVYTDFLPDDYAGNSQIERRIRWLVIHETDNYSPSADAQAHNSYLHSAKQQNVALSWHYTVDDHEIYHHLPDNIAAYHASDGMRAKGGNEAGIGIEICVNQGGDYQKAVDNAAQLCAYLLKSYRLDIDDIKQHHDFCGKDCPDRLRENDNWSEFLAKVKQYSK